jgi:hypothetical protein
MKPKKLLFWIVSSEILSRIYGAVAREVWAKEKRATSDEISPSDWSMGLFSAHLTLNLVS